RPGGRKRLGDDRAAAAHRPAQTSYAVPPAPRRVAHGGKAAADSGGGSGRHARYRRALGLPEVLCDPDELDVALLNLVVNARHATENRRGHVTVRLFPCDDEGSGLPPRLVARPPRFVCLAVIDDGCGMTEEVRRRAVEPFFSTKGEEGEAYAQSLMLDDFRSRTPSREPARRCISGRLIPGLRFGPFQLLALVGLATRGLGQRNEKTLGLGEDLPSRSIEALL